MNTLSLKSLIEWHTEQRNELEREENQENAFAFHSDAVNLLSAVYWHIESRTRYELTEKGKAFQS